MDSWETHVISPLEAELLANISGDRVLDHVRMLISPSERISGSPAEAEGARKVQGLLFPFIDRCELEGVEVTSYLRGKGKLEVISPINASFPCEVNPLTASGRGGGILADVRDGSRAAYEAVRGEVKGRIVLATGQSFGLGLVAREAKSRGALCVVYHMADRREDLIPVHGINVDFPVLSISGNSAAELRGLLSQHSEIHVSFETNLVRAPGISYNVVGVICGSQFPNETIYLTSHHDTWFCGANDNNATTACVLELARLFSRRRPLRSIKFVIHGSEESGAEIGSDAIYYDRGSFTYTELHQLELEGRGKEIPICVINGEMLGYTPRAQVQCTPELIAFVREVVADLEAEHQVSDPTAGWTSSDHLCYHTLGIPTIYLYPAPDRGRQPPSSYFRLYHTEGDNLDSVSVTALKSNAKLLALLVARLDAGDVPPYSLKKVVEEAERGVELLVNSQQIRNLLQDKNKRCAEALSREEQTRRTLELVRVINKNIYGFVGQVFVHKFAALANTVSKVRQAYHLIDSGGQREQVREILLSIVGAAEVANFSREVLVEVAKMREASPLLNRLSTLSFDLSDLLVEMAYSEPRLIVLSKLEAKIEECLKAAQAWGIAFEQALAAL